MRIWRPTVDTSEIETRAFENAEAFAKQINLETGARTFAWVSGSFILGDICEALITARGVGIKKLYIASLSTSQDNVDSLANVKGLMGDELERLVIVLSGWEYSRRKYGIVPYMYEVLDDPRNIVQIVFGRYHAKVITMETVLGHTITIHGSANLCSSSCVEQIMVEVDNFDLHQFNVDMMERAAAKFGTINTEAEYSKLKYLEGKESWEVAAWQAEARAVAVEA